MWLIDHDGPAGAAGTCSAPVMVKRIPCAAKTPRATVMTLEYTGSMETTYGTVASGATERAEPVCAAAPGALRGRIEAGQWRRRWCAGARSSLAATSADRWRLSCSRSWADSTSKKVSARLRAEGFEGADPLAALGGQVQRDSTAVVGARGPRTRRPASEPARRRPRWRSAGRCRAGWPGPSAGGQGGWRPREALGPGAATGPTVPDLPATPRAAAWPRWSPVHRGPGRRRCGIRKVPRKRP